MSPLNSVLKVYTASILLCAVAVLSAPTALLEGHITAKDSTIKVKHVSEEFATELQEMFNKPLETLAEPVVLQAESLDVTGMTGAEPESIDRAVIIAKSLDGSPYALAAPITIDKNALDQLKLIEGSFIQIVLPGKFDEEHVAGASDTGSASNSGELATMIYTEPTPEAAVESFMQRFLKLDPNENNNFIPDTVREALSSSKQVIIHPTSYLQVPDTQTAAAHQLQGVTSATPLHLIFGLFNKVL